MTYEEKKVFLSQYQVARREIDRECERVEEAKAQATKTTKALSGMPRGGAGGDAIGRAVERIIEARTKAEAVIEADRRLMSDIENAIRTMPTDSKRNAGRREVLDRRYIMGQKFEDIAVLMGRDYATVMRLHKEGIEACELNAIVRTKK